MSCYSHLTIEERESLMLFHEEGIGIRQIAKALGRSPSTISRELRRNSGPYRAVSAQRLTVTAGNAVYAEEYSAMRIFIKRSIFSLAIFGGLRSRFQTGCEKKVPPKSA